MKASLMDKQRAWVSLPIIALLLAMSSLSMYFQETLLANYQWRGQLHEVEEEQQIWNSFWQTVVRSPTFDSAVASECVGFCELGELAPQQSWQKENQLLYYRWESYERKSEEDEPTQTSYRLCATQNQQQYRCWWWREGRLLSTGWVSASG